MESHVISAPNHNTLRRLTLSTLVAVGSAVLAFVGSNVSFDHPPTCAIYGMRSVDPEKENLAAAIAAIPGLAESPPCVDTVYGMISNQLNLGKSTFKIPKAVGTE